MIFYALALLCVLPGTAWCQAAGLQHRAQSLPSANKAQTISLTVPKKTPLQIVLPREVRIRKTGQVLRGRIVQPVYAFDRLVIPVGTEVTGRIAKIDPVPGKSRTLAFLNADFTPAHGVHISFDTLTLPDGRQMQLDTLVTPGSGHVIQLISAGAGKKGGALHDAASQKMQAARQQWTAAMQQVKAPGKVHRLLRLGVAQLPVHPQYIDAGTLYFAELQQPLAFGSEEESASALSMVGTEPPPGALAHALLVTPLNSAITQKGTAVEAILSQPIMDGNQLLLPQGCRLRGTVLQVRPARHFHRNGQLRIAFHQLILPDGVSRSMETTLAGVQAANGDHVQLDPEGGARATSPKSMYLSTGVSVGLSVIGSGGRNDVGEGGPVAGGATAFKLVGITVGLIVRSHTLGIVMSAYGGSRAIYSTFFGRGTNISFPRNTAMDVSLGARNRSAPIVP